MFDYYVFQTGGEPLAHLDPFCVLVNCWWDDSPRSSSPFLALVHAILAVRDLPAHRRAQWRGCFAHFVFGADETSADERAIVAPDHEFPQALAGQLMRAALATLGRANES